MPKKYLTMRETSKQCKVAPCVLRYWESQFIQLRPARRRGHRYYQQHDIALIKRIRELLHVQGYTTRGAQMKLEEKIDELF